MPAGRYDLTNGVAADVAKSGGKPIQEGVRVRLPGGTTWAKLAEMTPAQIRSQDLWPAGFFPLPEFPAPIYLTTRPDLGDVSKGRLVTQKNFEELFVNVLNPKQLDGMRLLVTPFPQQQFNTTADRRSAEPSQGVACFDCHANGHTVAATHTVGDIRPNEHRHRIDTPTLR